MKSVFWYILENYVYRLPEPPARKRTKPMQVICVGLPRSGTESLQHALIRLGLDHTYHGWDILFEPQYIPAWVRLTRKKYFGDDSGTCHIPASEFDKVIGHSVAIVDAGASCFAAELMEAYPEAKVILNHRADLDAWHKSAVKNLVGINRNWMLFFLSWFNAELFWMWHGAERMINPRTFQCPGPNLDGIVTNGKWVYRSHMNMIKGLVPPEKLLVWEIGEGWEPLCKFLGKEVPNEPFPKANDAAGFQGRVDILLKGFVMRAFMNMAIILGVIVAILAIGGRYM